MQLHATLQSLHRSAAEAIEFLAGGELQRQASALAHHYERAGDAHRAAVWYQAAGLEAASQYANQDAITRFTKALELVDRDERSTRFDLVRSLEEVYRLVGDTDAQRSTVERLGHLAEHLDAEHRLLAGRVLTMYLTHLGEYAEAGEVGNRAMESADHSNDVLERLAIRVALAQVARASGDNSLAHELAHDARDVAEQSGSAVDAATADDLLGGIAYDRGDYVEAAEFHRSAAQALAREGDQVGEVRALNNLGSALWGMGDFSEAAKVHEAGINRAQAIGYRMSEGDNHDNLGGARWAVGRYLEAIEHYGAALRLRRRAKDAWGIGISLSNLANAYRSAGQPKPAVDHFLEGIDVDRSIGRRRGEAFSHHGLGWAYLDLENHDLAHRAFSMARDIRIDIDEPAHAIESLTGLAAWPPRKGATMKRERWHERSSITSMMSFVKVQTNRFGSTTAVFAFSKDTIKHGSKR